MMLFACAGMVFVHSSGYYVLVLLLHHCHIIACNCIAYSTLAYIWISSQLSTHKVFEGHRTAEVIFVDVGVDSDTDAYTEGEKKRKKRSTFLMLLLCSS